MSHVVDDLEFYAVGALPPDRAGEIAAHLGGCVPCRSAAEDLGEVVASLADAIPPTDPPARLKDRILAAAGNDVRARRPRIVWPRIALGLPQLAMALAVVILAGVAGERTLRLRTLQAESEGYEAMAANFAHGGRSWYMAGVEQWRGMGGNLMQPASGDPAFVLFHDLRPLEGEKVYALWLIARDNSWVRGTSFRPDGRTLQFVMVGQELAGFERCAVTIEPSSYGKREGPVVMQSRIAAPGP